MNHTFQQIAPTDHFGPWHAHYLTVYERLFRTVGNGAILEIGCDGGGGILTYADWFSHIPSILKLGEEVILPRPLISCDISPRPPSLDLNPQIRHYQGNAYSPDFISEVLQKHAPYSVIIDDGPHTLGTQMFFAEHYPKMLTKDGIAIIEDIQHVDHVAQLIGKLPPEFMGYAIDLRWADDRYDSLILVIERK